METDIEVENHGSIFLLRPVSDTGKEWLKEHIAEDAQWLGPAVAVDHRYVQAIVAGAQEEGLIVQ